jgi:hypothetical protein
MRTFKLKVKDYDDTGNIVVTQEKEFYNLDGGIKASKWVRRNNQGKGVDAPQMSNALSVKDQDGRGSLVPGSIAYMTSNMNNPYDNTSNVFITPSCSYKANGFSVLPSGLRDAVALFLARKSIQQNWLNDKDEYAAPNEDHPDFAQWVNDAIVYSLFNTSSCQSSLRNITYKGKSWDIINEFFWIPLQEVKLLADANTNQEVYQDTKNHPGKYNGERYVTDIIKTTTLSLDAKAVLDEATRLVVESFPFRKDTHLVHPEFHLNTWDAGWYQVMNGLLKTNFKKELKDFREQYKAFEDRLRPGVFEFGFLRR